METKRPVEEIADLRIVDNWLDPNDFKTIKDLFYHEDTTWNLVPGISNNDSTNAIKNPLKVKSMTLRGIFLCRRFELLWFYQYGASEIFPDEFEKYISVESGCIVLLL